VSRTKPAERATAACDCCRATTEPLERLTLAGGIIANACVYPASCIQRAKAAGFWLLGQPEGVPL